MTLSCLKFCIPTMQRQLNKHAHFEYWSNHILLLLCSVNYAIFVCKSLLDVKIKLFLRERKKISCINVRSIIRMVIGWNFSDVFMNPRLTLVMCSWSSGKFLVTKPHCSFWQNVYSTGGDCKIVRQLYGRRLNATIFYVLFSQTEGSVKFDPSSY